MSPIVFVAPTVEILALSLTWWICRWKRKQWFLKEAQFSELSLPASKLSMTGSGSAGAGLTTKEVAVLTAYFQGSSKISSSPDEVKVIWGGNADALVKSGADFLEMANEIQQLNSTMSSRARMLMFYNPDYREVVDLLLAAAGWGKAAVLCTPPDAKMTAIIEINDNMESPEAAKAWFQRALELTL